MGAHSRKVAWREALALGAAVPVNNVFTGVGAGLAGIPDLLTTFLSGAFSLLALGGGAAAAGHLARSVFPHHALLTGALLLLAAGFSMLPGIR